ncbi:hypothetical protein SXCC_02615 [Gluconacetobacter sp. SXCC-1]|nr:hypothetical protein SXCC_02615 [Gluconacetobacter sp. SXCC-1]
MSCCLHNHAHKERRPSWLLCERGKPCGMDHAMARIDMA